MLIIAMVALVALAGLGGFTALSVQSGLEAQSASRFQSVALYAAESGVAAGMEFLRAEIDPINNWSHLMSQNNTAPQSPTVLPGNGVLPGAPGNPFLNAPVAYQGWYEVSILNNIGDQGIGLSPLSPPPLNRLDTDARVILRVVGHGPNGATVTLEVDVTANNADRLAGNPCSYESQEQMGAMNAGIGCINQNLNTSGGVVVAP